MLQTSKKTIKKLIIPILLLVMAMSVFFANPVFAQLNPWEQSGDIQEKTGLSETSPVEVVINIIKIFLGFLGIIAVVLVMYAGFIWMTSNGNVEKITKAKKILISALIGLIIILSSYGIASFVLNQLTDATSDSGGGSSVCVDGNITTCCSGSGTRTCVGGVWGACSDSFCGAFGGGSDTTDVGAGWGESCGTTPGNCEASTTCAVDLVCDIADCTCQGPPVIDWVSPAGGFCKDKTGNPTDVACLNDVNCSAIANGPGICDVIAPNGAVGNLVTIGGRYFGTSTGSIEFNGTVAKLANDANGGNPSCTDAWSDKKVVVIVPGAGDVNGPIKITRPAPDGEEDTTNNLNRGAVIPNFLKNNIQRPGLCGIDPDSGVIGTEVDYNGINLLGVSAFFGSYTTSSISGNNSVFATNLFGKANVPSMQTGRTTTYVQKNLTNSNYYPFEKIKESDGQPAIISFDPIKGNSGQYVTIHGRDFGYASASQLGVTHHIYLDKDLSDTDLGIEASFAFPEICSENVWSDKQIIFKVATSTALVDNTKYYIVVATNNWTVDSGKLLAIGEISPTFTFSSSEPLSPSLCMISPRIGLPNITNVNLYGEYFGTRAGGKVDFYKNVSMSGFSDAAWLYNKADNYYQVATQTPLAAISGPVVVLQGANKSNSLNFEIGSCLDAGDTQQMQNIACGSICCPGNSSMAGQCATTMNECYVGGAKTSVFEWDFDTGRGGGIGDPCDMSTTTAVCEPDNTKCATGLVCDANKDCTCQPDVDACASYDLLQCQDGYFCPNSPGKCSPYAGGTGVIDVEKACTATNSEGLVYNNSLNRYASSTQSCSLGGTVKDVLGKNVPTFCALYNNTPHYQMKTKLSCPIGWTMIYGGVCVNMASNCELCDGNFECLSDNNTGICAVNTSVCPNGSTCNGGKCVKDDKASCDCCCEIGSTGDCCAGLTCAGTCGTDTQNDGAGLGSCSGCNIDGDQAKSDAACNCTGTSGKYCDMSAGGGVGVCQDCASLPTGACSDHSGSCCVDGMNGNKCTGGAGDTLLDLSSGLIKNAYCSYYNCGDSCATASTTGAYDDESICDSVCNAPAPGTDCISLTASPLQCVDNYCGVTSPYDCYGGNQNNPADCGSCCCEVTNNASTDLCTAKNPILSCQYVSDGKCADADKDSATSTPPSPDFGLCCGCQADGDCGSAENTGCSEDSCCRPRPFTISSSPEDDATSVCRNAKIEVAFDQAMDVNSFLKNVIVVGDYGASQCPDGTQYLAVEGLSDKRNVFAKIYYKVISFVKPILPAKIANALSLPTTSNYCSIQGSVKGYTTAGDTGVLEFIPKSLLDTKRLYYVIIKGDNALNGQAGVKSIWGVGMNDEINLINPTDISNGDIVSTKMFNGIVYEKAHVFSFETLGSQAVNNGVCLVDKVSISPISYLFQDNVNDVNDDIYTEVSFDKTKDSDKIFIAKALSGDGQVLSGVSSVYDWNWNWSISDQNIATTTVTAGLPSYESLVRVNNNVVDGKTDVTARLTITSSTFGDSPVGANLAAIAKAYVLICSNPWPPIKADGTWLPWIDTSNNCDINTGACSNANFESYYCRDFGSAGTLDDLPALGNDDSIVRGTSSQKSLADLIKEVYFFRGREANTLVNASFVATSSLTAVNGGVVDVSWPSNAFSGVSVKNYKVYWGLNSGSHTFSKIVSPPQTSVNIDGLKNNTIYYFNMTAISNDSGAESNFLISQDAVVLVKDTYPPDKVLNFTASSTVDGILLKWDAVDNNLSKYIVYYGVNDSYGSSKEVGSIENNTIITDLTIGKSYNFGIKAFDATGNESVISTATEVFNN